MRKGFYLMWEFCGDAEGFTAPPTHEYEGGLPVPFKTVEESRVIRDRLLKERGSPPGRRLKIYQLEEVE